jgi:hypothetical protein
METTFLSFFAFRRRNSWQDLQKKSGDMTTTSARLLDHKNKKVACRTAPGFGEQFPPSASGGSLCRGKVTLPANGPITLLSGCDSSESAHSLCIFSYSL